MTALIASPAQILADIARVDGRTGRTTTPPGISETARLIAVGVNPHVAAFLGRRTRHVTFTPATAPPPRLQPCGTHAAYNRHRAHGERPDAACREAEYRYQKRRQRTPSQHTATAAA